MTDSEQQGTVCGACGIASLFMCHDPKPQPDGKCGRCGVAVNAHHPFDPAPVVPSDERCEAYVDADGERPIALPRGNTMTYKQYRRSAVAEMADWHDGFDMTGVSVSEADRANGSPLLGDKIARNPKNHDDRWLVAAAYFADNFEPLTTEGKRRSTSR